MIDHFQRSSFNYFAASPIDRFALNRRDDAWVQAQVQSEKSRFVPVWSAKNLITAIEKPNEVLLTYAEAEAWLGDCSPILLGGWGDHIYFTFNLPATDETIPQRFEDVGVFHDLRLNMDDLADGVANVLVFAKAMAYWHQRHTHCGDCGSLCASKEAGYMRECTNPDCRAKHFPRSDPAIIVLVHSEERCLLARQPTWPPGRYSVVAGFVEPGESLEDAVLREVAEETNVTIKSVHYHSSQPWPFPSSLMVGYHAEAATTNINLNDNELEHAHWLSRADIVAKMKDGSLLLPPAISISHRLIETWFDEGDEGKLSDLVAVWAPPKP